MQHTLELESDVSWQNIVGRPLSAAGPCMSEPRPGSSVEDSALQRGPLAPPPVVEIRAADIEGKVQMERRLWWWKSENYGRIHPR